MNVMATHLKMPVFTFFPSFLTMILIFFSGYLPLEGQDSLRTELLKTTGLEHVKTLNLLSENIRIDSPDIAFRYALRAVVLSRNGRFSDQEAMAWKNLAFISIQKKRFKQAEDYLSVALRMANHKRNPSTLVEIFKGLGRLNIRQKNYRKALETLTEAEKIRSNASLNHDPVLYEMLADCYKNLNDNTRAIDFFRTAAEHYSRQDPYGRLPFVLGYLAILYNEWGWDEKALDCFNKALGLLLKSGDSIGAAYTYCNMADVYSRAVGHRKAIEYTQKALDIFEGKKDHGGMGYALNGLGTSYYKLGDQVTAMIYFRRSVEQHRMARAYEHLSFTLANIGEMYLNDGDYYKALPYLKNAADYADSAKSDLARSSSFSALGKYYQKTGNFSMSLATTLESQKIASKRGFKQLIADNYLLLAESCQRMGNLSDANQYLKKHLTLHDSLASEKSRKVVAEMEAKFSLESKERLIERLTIENELKRETILSKNRFTLLVIVSSLVIVLLLSLLSWSYYMKVKAYQRAVKNTVDQLNMHNLSISTDEKISWKTETSLDFKPVETGHGNHEAGRQLIERLISVVENEKLFLNPELSMSDVAERLQTNTSYLSRAVNEILKKNFPAYINELRIREAQRLLADRNFANRSIEGIALMSGFRSKSAFNDAFRKFTGMTPSFFQRSALKL